MGDKKKHKDKDRERSQSRDRRKSKKKREEKSKDREKSRKRKHQRRDYSDSQSSSSDSKSSSSSSSVSRSRDKASQKKKKDKEKQDKSAIKIPFAMSQPPPPIIPINPLTAIRPVGGIVIPPPAPIVTTTTSTTKPKTKQSHIFKLMPKLPLGAVQIGRTIYSSSLFSSGFENKMLNTLCEDLEKSARAEGFKKMANLISKVKQDINILNLSGEGIKEEKKSHKNQFDLLDQVYNQEVNKIRKEILRKDFSAIKI